MENNLKVITLKRHADFEAIRKDGRAIKINAWFVVFYKTSKHNIMRVGWTIPAYVGTAVVRNRIKRWIRVYLKELSTKLEPKSADLNLMFKKQSKFFYRDLKHKELEAALDDVFKKMQR